MATTKKRDVLLPVFVMVFLASVLLIAINLAFAAASGSVSAPGKEPISLVEVGTSYTTGGDGKTTPIYAVMIGNTLKAEEVALALSRHFGPYAVNATIWVHRVDQPADTWTRIIFHRPRNIYETQVFFDDQGAWEFEETDKASVILPSFARALTPAELLKVDFIVTYFDGGTKVYLKSEVTTEEAKKLFEAFEQALR